MLLSLLAVAQGIAHAPGFAGRVGLVALSGFLAGSFLTPLARAVPGSAWRRFWILELIIFTLSTLSNGMEVAPYLQVPPAALAAVFAGGVVQTVILAAVLARVARPTPGEPAGGEGLPAVRLRAAPSAGFVALAAVLWVPVYFLFETLDTPVVHLLERGTAGVFSHPALGPMLGGELIRGALHAAVMLGIVVLSRGRAGAVWLWGALEVQATAGDRRHGRPIRAVEPREQRQEAGPVFGPDPAVGSRALPLEEREGGQAAPRPEAAQRLTVPGRQGRHHELQPGALAQVQRGGERVPQAFEGLLGMPAEPGRAVQLVQREEVPPAIPAERGPVVAPEPERGVAEQDGIHRPVLAQRRRDVCLADARGPALHAPAPGSAVAGASNPRPWSATRRPTRR